MYLDLLPHALPHQGDLFCHCPLGFLRASSHLVQLAALTERRCAVKCLLQCTKADVLSHMSAMVRSTNTCAVLAQGCAGTCTAAGSPCAVAAAAVAAAVSAACDSFSFSRSNSKAAAPQQGCELAVLPIRKFGSWAWRWLFLSALSSPQIQSHDSAVGVSGLGHLCHLAPQARAGDAFSFSHNISGCRRTVF